MVFKTDFGKYTIKARSWWRIGGHLGMTNSSVTVGATVVVVKAYILFTGTWRLLLLVMEHKKKK
jgi:hypothetical protein